ncbi:MAG: heavy-metal-associated domain-containing protein [Chloroflexi bacterium]|nr:heavy-metal-associated domain-containing protein [Chloroflexota bacterium]
MPQMTLFAPDITCDHCIATISKAVASVEGARFIAGDPESRTFAVEVASGAVLDRVAATLAEEGYPLGEIPAPGAAPSAPSTWDGMTALPMAGALAGGMRHGAPAPGFKPEYLKVERTDAGADVTYSCPCGSTTEVFHLDRSQAEQEPHSCCGHHTLVGPNAAARLRARLGEGYAIDVQTVTMPWRQPVEAAQAVKA